MIQIRANNKIYNNFKKAEVSIDMDNLCGSFSFVSSADKDNLHPLKMNDYIEIDVDGKQIINGFIDTLDVSYSSNNHDIRIGGRGLIGDILDSCVHPNVTDDFKEIITTTYNKYADFEEIEAGGTDIITTTSEEVQGPRSFKHIAKNLLAANKMKSLSNNIKNMTGSKIEKFTKEEFLSMNVGETVYDFLETLARKKQLLLNSDEFGNLVFSRGVGEMSKVINTLTNKINNNDNNILSASLSLNNRDRFCYYTVLGSLNKNSVDGDFELKHIVAQWGDGIDIDIRNSRSLIIISEEGSNDKECALRSEWEKNIRKARSFKYIATVQGHSENNIPYRINTLTKVKDEFCKLNTTLLIKSVRFNYSIDDGSTTTLGCVLKDSYSLLLEDIKTSDVSGNFVSKVSLEEGKADKANERKGGYEDFDAIHK